MATYQKKTEYGTITIKDEIVFQIIEDAVRAFRGKLVLSDAEGRLLNLSHKIRGLDESDCITLDADENGLKISCCVAIRFGASIGRTAQILIQRIQRGMKTHFGREAADVTVHVVGVIMTQGVTRRNIAFHSESKE